LIGDLAATISALETHVAEMNYAGTDDFNAHTFASHRFQNGAYRVLHDLAHRVQQLSNDLDSAEQERRSYAALSPRQQTARTQQLEQATQDAEADQRSRAHWQQGATARETAWAALPPQSTAPGRYQESVKRCANCGGRVDTINGIRRCWDCYRRSQNGR
jgi:ADP-ribosylglycohydrolase